MRLIAAIAATITLGLAPASEADVAHLLHGAYRRAVAYMHGAPCNGRVTLRLAWPGALVRQSEQGYAHPGAPYSWATWLGPLGPDNPFGDPHSFTSCVVTFNREYWDAATLRIDFPIACTAMIHELGNLDGLPETEERTGRGTYNVRDAYIDEILTPRACL